MEKKFYNSPVWQLAFNWFFTWFWVANLIIATYAFYLQPSFWAKASVFYLVMVSLWANIATHFGAVSSAEAAMQTQEKDR